MNSKMENRHLQYMYILVIKNNINRAVIISTRNGDIEYNILQYLLYMFEMSQYKYGTYY